MSLGTGPQPGPRGAPAGQVWGSRPCPRSPEHLTATSVLKPPVYSLCSQSGSLDRAAGLPPGNPTATTASGNFQKLLPQINTETPSKSHGTDWTWCSLSGCF